LKYTATPSPGHVVVSPSRALITPSWRLSKLCVWPRKKPRERNSAQTILGLVLICGLLMALSGCGSGFHGASLGSLQITPNTVNFGAVAVGQAASTGVAVVNESSSSVVISNLSFDGATFSANSTDTLPISIPAGGSHTLQVQFKPTVAGPATGQLTVSSNSTTDGTAVVPLAGMGMAPASSQLTVSATNLSFGSVPVSSSTTQSITLTSTGTSPVTVNSASTTGTGFTIVGGSFPITLNPNQTATVQVQFQATIAGPALGQLTIGSNSATNANSVVALSGTGTAIGPSDLNPQLSVSTVNLSFGSVTVNSSTTQSITLTSTGTSPVTVNSASITGTGFTIVAGSFPVTLNPSQTATMQVQFKPIATGSDTGQITITSDSATARPAVVALSGAGTAALNPQLSVSTANLSFGSVTVNSPTTQAITLISTGTSPVTVNSASITGTGFTIVGGSFPTILNPSQTATIQVQFKPTATGSDSGQVTITSDSATASTAVVALSGTGTAALNPQLSVSTANLSFGSVTVNSPTTQSITLTSTGTSPVTVNSASITGSGFTIVAGSFPITLNPSQAVTLQIQFLPATAGADTGQITITSNSTTGSPAVVALSGTGTASNPQLTVSTTTLSFGSVDVNSSTTQSVTLSSTGTSPVTVNSASISGTGFTIVGGSFPVTLNPSQTATIQVQFKPTAAGSDTGQITISSNSTSGSPTNIALNGTGTAVSYSVNLSWDAPTTSTDPVVGYNIYRSVGTGAFQLVNSSPDATTTYVDNAVSSGTTYNYLAKSVDSTGVESTASNEITVAIP
jgi:Abnormal spindle-like microcephaly-assoc'd, ASPM-SPD-2-Hydin